MKEHVEKSSSKKYIIITFIVLSALIIFLLFAGFKAFSGKEKPKGSISVSFDDSTIKTGESTYLSLGAKNNGKVPLAGEFKIKIDNPEYVNINYPDSNLLKFELMPGESIERRINITGTSKAYKTYYKLTVSIESENATYAEEEALLVVRND